MGGVIHIFRESWLLQNMLYCKTLRENASLFTALRGVIDALALHMPFAPACRRGASQLMVEPILRAQE